MVAVKFGNADKDLSSRVGKKTKTKELTDKPLKAAGSEPFLSAKIGGIANRKGNPSARKGFGK